MKISVFGAGNVGSLTAMRLAQDGAGEIVLVDVAGGIACGKAFDLEDAAALLNIPYSVRGTDDPGLIKGSDIVVITAGLARKPGMTREELLQKNSAILKEICLHIKKLAPDALVIVVTNPLDIMTNYALKITNFKPQRLFGMGISLDAARFANLIARELKVSVTDIEPWVIGSHGEGMLPLPRFTTVKGVNLDESVDAARLDDLAKRTVNRGAEIVSHLGSGSAFFAPSAAVAGLVRSIVKDEKRTIGVCAHLNGEYGIKDVCIGVPCTIGRGGIEEIIQFDLNENELKTLRASADSIKEMVKKIHA